MIRRHLVFLVVGIMSLIFALLPWLGLGGYAFVVPGTDIVPPRLELLSRDSVPMGHQVYSVMEFPLHLVALIPPLDDVVYFQGEGVVTVRPFMIFVFWALTGAIFVWIAVRPYVLPRSYGHLTM